jgi:hypothetical protein
MILVFVEITVPANRIKTQSSNGLIIIKLTGTATATTKPSNRMKIQCLLIVAVLALAVSSNF